jgi:hypothetical protein
MKAGTIKEILRRLEAIENKINPPVSKTGNWVVGLSGKLVWDAYDFPEPTEEEAAATLDSLLRQMEQIAERLHAQPGYEPPTEAEQAEAMRGFEEARERYAAEKKAVRDFTAKIERERAERAAGV